MKIKTSELTGAALDWAVAKCEGVKVVKLKHGRATFSDPFDDGALNEMFINYSTDWAQGGPIIEREGISIDQRDNGSLVLACIDAPMEHEENEIWVNGPTPLIAAMRCYVASKLGDEVEVIDAFLEGK